ncbi:hypothetical protein K7I13_14035 [Brucepastera parasyntrophica]|uniref:hypothetical protein n=1 Tax=Brucepastera parasyntrophica TaxID=2880008 RepID=UPI00210DAF53|nr:hypothetical protein [Brucepastera parasyntrophica]ULQ59567.1 hypothetical protein K7I13_14035 [Brucepastera parasyntrophica]
MNKITEYLPHIDINENAYVEVYGTIYPGIQIEICHVPFSVTQIYKKTRFRLDKPHGEIITDFLDR